MPEDGNTRRLILPLECLRRPTRAESQVVQVVMAAGLQEEEEEGEEEEEEEEAAAVATEASPTTEAVAVAAPSPKDDGGWRWLRQISLILHCNDRVPL